METNTQVERLLAEAKDHHSEGRYEEALVAVNRAVELDPQNARILGDRGFLLNEVGRHDEALADLDRAVELEPNDFTSKATGGHSASSYVQSLSEPSHQDASERD
jgi:Flp pilus assembly protein TadD